MPELVFAALPKRELEVIRRVVLRGRAATLIEQDGLSQIALVGYSMGGNLVMKLVGEWSGNAPKELRCAVGVSPAMDLSPSADALHNPGNRIYEWKFLRGLRRRFRRKASLFPNLYDLTHARAVRTIREFEPASELVPVGAR